MYQTIQMSSCVSVYGEFVEALQNGEIVVRDGNTVYRGRPIGKPVAKPAQNHAEVARPGKLSVFGMSR